MKEKIKGDQVKEIWQQKIPAKVALLLILSIVIGYFLSPKIIFSPVQYEEGDIILKTISIDEDLLIPDQVSTKLKQEQLQSELGSLYDFDPNVLENTRKTVKQAFQTTRSRFQQLDRDGMENELRKRDLGLEFFYKNQEIQEDLRQSKNISFYKKFLEKNLEDLGSDKKLTAKGFDQKKQLDSALNLANQMIKGLSEKQELAKQEIKGFPLRFKQRDEETGLRKKEVVAQKETAIRNFLNQFPIELSNEEQQLLEFPFYEERVETQVLDSLPDLLGREIVVARSLSPTDSDAKIEIRNLVTGESTSVENLDNFMDVTEVRELVNEVVKDRVGEEEGAIQTSFVIMLLRRLIQPTLTENKLEFEKRKEELASTMNPVFFSVKKGEIIARTGERASKYQVQLISGYYDVISNQDKLPQLLGSVLVVFFSLGIVFVSFQVRGKAFRLSLKELILIGSVIVATMALVKGGVMIGEVLETRYTDIVRQSYRFIFPVALASMIVGILLSFETAIMTGLLTSMFVSIMMQGDLYYFFYAMMGSIVASLPMTKFESRYSLLNHGLKLSAINIPVIVLIYLIEINQTGGLGWIAVASALISGVLTSIIVSVLLPLFESVFDLTSNLRLLELSNMNNPALKDLIFQAPGTYQHSIIVGNLAEAGAVRIGANPLLARVGAYYHDLGKGVESQYFIENQPRHVQNIHDQLDPFESARRIINHITDGAKIADKRRLGKAIKDILVQHHGTGLVKYFYEKAKTQAKEQGDQKIIDESKFRYPGPKPQTLEAALVMLADMSEASTRSLDDPSAENINAMLNKVCWAILRDGQLDESGITLSKFRTVIEEYSSVIESINHHRIKYPEDQEIEKKSTLNLIEMPSRRPLS